MITVTRYFLKKKVGKLAKEAPNRPKLYRSLDDVKHVLVLCEAKDWGEFNHILGVFQKLDKQVQVCTHVRKQDQSIHVGQGVVVKVWEDLTLWGFPRKNVEQQFCSIPADILIDLTTSGFYEMRYLLLKHPSQFKVGTKRIHEGDWYDLSIVLDDDVHNASLEFRLGQILNYLQIIRSRR